MIGHGNSTCLFSVVVACKKVVLIVPGEHRGPFRMILPPANVHAFSVIDTIEDLV